MQGNREIKVTPVFKENWKALCNSEKRFICNEGGSRSGKTYSIMQMLIIYCSNNNGITVTVCSHSLPHLKRGALRDFLEIMNKWGMYRESCHNKTDQIYTFPKTGSYIEFIGLEDEGKARGPGRDILFCNEANLIKKSVFDQLNMRTRWKVITDLNPSDFSCWAYQIADSNEAVKIVSTYQNNITNLPPSQIAVIEGYKETDQMMWNVFGLGKRGASKEQIYTHWKYAVEWPESKGSMYYGLDFGYNVPTALVQIVEYDGEVYVRELIYKTKLTTSDLIAEMNALNLERGEIFCDAAEPKTIEEIHRAGFNAKPSDKDVTEGIRKVKGVKLLIDRSSENLIRELHGYKWKLDKNENPIDEPVKENDHAVDAMRYAIYTRSKSFKFKVIT